MSKISNVGWSIGNYCNAKCKHCYSWKTRKDNQDMLTQEEIDTIITKLIEYRVKTVNFGGNEPIFTHGSDVTKTRLPYIIETLHKNEIVCGITTNGYTALHLYENYPEIFMMVNDWDFSLDAPCKEEHDFNRNKQGAFDNVLRGLQICTELKRPKSIVIAGMKNNLNKEVLKEFIKLSREYYAEIRINLLKPIEEHHMELFPKAEQVYEAFQYLLDETDLVTLSEPVLACQTGIDINGCPCGRHSFRIRSKKEGRVPVTPCVYLELDGGDILTETIDEIVNSKVFAQFCERNNSIPSECRSKECLYIESCRGGCTARTFLVNDNFNSVDPYCPLNLSNDFKKNFTGRKLEKISGSVTRVHENYLCTWIGNPNKEGGK